MWPALDQFFARGAPLPLRGSAALGSLRLAPKGQGRREDNLQKEIYTPNFWQIGLSTPFSVRRPSNGDVSQIPRSIPSMRFPFFLYALR
jgi:hypothetical protein